jgi:hypothetical protein
MPRFRPITRRTLLSGVTAAGVGAIAARARQTRAADDWWTPDDLGERIYATWQGKLDEPVPFDSLAFKANRAVVAIFNGDLEFHVNGTQRPQPGVFVSDGSARVQWAKDRREDNEITFPVGSGWHCLVSRRYKGRHFASLDGSPEVAVGEHIVCPRFRGGKRPDGYIDGEAMIWLVQGEMVEAEAQKFMGWACHASGIALPPNHPYASSSPLAGPEDWRSTFVEPAPEEWDAMSYDLSYSGTPLDLAGYGLVFEDHFTEMNISHEDEGPGPWWAPVHGSGTGGAKQGFIDDDPPVFIHNGSEVVLRTRRNPGSDIWKAGIFCSINQAGDGNTWTPPFYIEWNVRNTLGNGYATFPAVWLKSVNEYFMVTETTIELDVWEGRNIYPDYYHMSYHNHDALKPVPGRLADDRHISGNAYPGLMYDNGYHTYAVKIDGGLIVHYFDGREVGRMLAHAEIYQPMFILVDNALKRRDMEQADGIYDMGIDYIRVYQVV